MLFTDVPLGPLMVNVVVVQLLDVGRPQGERAAAGGVLGFAGGGALTAGGGSFGSVEVGGGACTAHGDTGDVLELE
jgi:hypothetical protein